MKLKNKLKTIFNKLLKDKKGQRIIWQFPNKPVVGWFVFMLFTHLISDGQLRTSLEFVSMAFLFTWAYLELFQGVNYLRRLLGLAVLIMIFLSFYK